MKKNKINKDGWIRIVRQKKAHRKRMGLAIEWIVWPILGALVCVVYWGYRMACTINQIDLQLPPAEVRITGIHAPDVGTPRGLYMVTFSTTGRDTPFYLEAPEIAARCVRHQQKIPSFIIADPKIDVSISYPVGDDLVVAIGSGMA